MGRRGAVAGIGPSQTLCRAHTCAPDGGAGPACRERPKVVDPTVGHPATADAPTGRDDYR
jgi:hypothetical protein